MGKCILVCAGDFVPVEIEKNENDIVIAVDGGLRYCLQQSLMPDYIIGDFDSLENEYFDFVTAFEEDHPENVRKLPREKDDTDTIAAVKYGFELGFLNFHIYGALGGDRLEHTMANLQTLLFIKNRGGKGYLLDHSSMITVLKNERVTLGEKGPAYVSLFAIEGTAKGVTLQNMKYEITDAMLTADYPLGISNELIGVNPTIEVKDGSLLMILRWL